MKKKMVYLFFAAVLVIGLVAFTGCTGNPDKDAKAIVDYINANPGILDQVDTSSLKGTDGKDGKDGATGATGPAGVAGPVGPAGKDGINGADGAIGPAGQDGFNGQDGADGAPGPVGPAGPTGPAGFGATGATGATGPAGVAGFPPPPVYDVALRTTGVSTATLSTAQSNTGIFSAYLKTDGATGTGRSGTIILTPLTSMTLAQVVSVAWQEYLVTGYPPHLDITVNLIGGGTDTLVFEYAYNGDSHYLAEAPMPYGALTGAWYATFSDDGAGPAAVTGTSFAWLNSGAAGPYPPSGGAFVGGTLADWIAGLVDPSIDGTVTIVKLEIEVDNWVVESEAYVDDIEINGVPVYWLP